MANNIANNFFDIGCPILDLISYQNYLLAPSQQVFKHTRDPEFLFWVLNEDELSNLDGLQIHLRFQCCKDKTSGKNMWWFFSQKVTGSFLPTDKFDMDFQKVTFIFDFRLKECCSFEVKPFLANVPILYPLKTTENLWFSGVFRGRV